MTFTSALQSSREAEVSRAQTNYCYCRFEQMANEMLAETTIAGQEGVIEYVANSAALQQFEQTSLAYLMLRQAQEPLNAKGLCIAVESLLEETFQV